MPLLSLPQELLFIILRLVGPREFQQDVGRLTICRKWYTFAQIIIFEGLELSRENLVRLRSHMDAGKGQATRENPGAHLRDLSICLENCRETLWHKDQPGRVRRTPLNIALQQFAEGLSKGLNRLRTLNFETPSPKAKARFEERPKEVALFTASILSFLDPSLSQSLQTLHLDLAHSFRTETSSEFGTFGTFGTFSTFGPSPAFVHKAHYCLSIAKLLHRLSHVKIRLPRICPDCFAAGQDISSRKTQTETAAISRLKTLVVCLSVCDEDVGRVLRFYGRYSRCCQGLKTNSFSLHYVVCPPSWTKLLESVKSLARRSPNLKMARLLANRPIAVSSRLVAWDCINGQKYKMGEHDPWDAEITDDGYIAEEADVLSADW